MSPQVSFPAPLDDDHEDVHWALSTAGSLHSQGEVDEALRWLRKAVAAAVACDLDARAIELGRMAADIEESLGAASTLRGESSAGADTDAEPRTYPNENTERSAVRPAFDTFADQEIDGLDDPTHVDSSRSASSVANPSLPNPSVSAATQSSPGPATLQDGTPAATLKDISVDSEPTLVPFTEMSPGVVARLRTITGGAGAPVGEDTLHSHHPRAVVSKTVQLDESPPRKRAVDTATLPAYTAYEDGEATVAMQAPNFDEVRSEQAAHEATMPAMTTLTRFRVAMLASADSHEPRVILLGKSAEPPPGAGVATLVPVSSADAQVIAALLEATTRRDP